MPKPSHPLLRSIGLAIRSRRRERGLSQESLADLAKIDRSYMSSVERGLRNVSILSIARIAGALEIPLADLLRPRRAAAGMPRHDWGAGAWEVPGVVPSVEPVADYVAACPPNPAPGPAAPGWEPRYLSLG